MKATIISIFLVVILIGGTIFLTRGNSDLINDVNNVNIVDGKQIIEIKAKGGYFPKITKASANIPTTIKMISSNNFDCSSSLVIPSLNYSTNLPFTGETLIEIPVQKTSTKLQGLCAMGMYSFIIEFN